MYREGLEFFSGESFQNLATVTLKNRELFAETQAAIRGQTSPLSIARVKNRVPWRRIGRVPLHSPGTEPVGKAGLGIFALLSVSHSG